jgi:large subunit ribosomal protein L25
MADTLQVESRKEHGKRSARRMRGHGKVPAVLYGHGEKTVSLAVPAEQLTAAVDFTRVSADERVKVRVPLEVRGQAAGVKEGGMLEHLIHEVEIECPVVAIPDKLLINVSALKIGESMTVGQATLPEGVKIVSGADQIAVNVAKPKEEEEEAAATGEAVEPELIRKEKPAEEEEEK